jgi:Ca-activated chloride channel family protein
MHIETDRSLIPHQIPSVRHLTVTITAPPRQAPAHERPPVHAGFVIDRSGSMAGRKIEMARRAVAHAVKLLDARDRFALVSYDDRVETIVESAPATAAAKKHAMAGLADVDARGSTNLAGGWFRGVELIAGGSQERRPAAGDDSVRRVLLLTDGLANVGITDHAELCDAAARFRQQGITTSTFGVGADFDEELLSAIATHGGGHFYFIEEAKQIPDFLASELGETLEIVGRDVAFEVATGPGVSVMLLNDLPAETNEGRLRVRLGDLVADQEITMALAITCAPRPAGGVAFADCRVADRDGQFCGHPMRVEWTAADMGANERQPVNQDVLVAVASVLADRARAMALAENRRGNFVEARRILRDMIEHLRGLAPGHEEVRQIVDRLEDLAMRARFSIDSRSRKEEHYALYLRGRSREPGGKARRRKK